MTVHTRQAALSDCSGAWRETELLRNGKRVRHGGVSMANY
jgi:hypothetical protein